MEGVHHRTFYSELYAHDVGYNIYLPDGYEANSKRYPVVYHFHGYMGSESSEIQPLERAYRGREAITVFVNHSHVTGDVKELPSAPMLIQELIPHIDGMYRTIASREGRAVSGFSAGGGVAARLAFRYPELFSAVTAYSGTYHHYYHPDYSTVYTPVDQAAGIYRAMMEEQKFFEGSIIQELLRNADRIRGRVNIALHVGTEDPLYCDNEILHLHLNALQIQHEYRIYRAVGHVLNLIL